ncbi:HIT domain-containing protein [Helcobacillus massiliensis]|uniref:HIT domain-containing protein n=1 Tax=Helcobacillus TaxID=1161125 RepID=UPI001EF6F414|nr:MULTISPECIES: HIT domain-containing protein [Helcobacillus]MCG7426581.1 HIT domain-containing protein [Helcobacillus sp. ACRRO]MCT1557163.1 HIT domain-containing protein [Helcobacillus massiliensis]MCT2036102.1 HIT domain-containing protein [Helcobacillus massiliensis]MCT2331233.1 HIT domain-containing protein [Helcobacillus massiliensis]MDK7741232.1 HIT domain-containing protein [Helcobacillus massiliensis]
MTDHDCVFCRIIAGDIPSDRVYEDEDVIAFKDLNPAAPVHVLVVPRKHVPNVVALSAEPALLAAVASAAGTVAQQEANGDFRFVFNTGETAGQTVFHVHGHVLAGTDMSEGEL